MSRHVPILLAYPHLGTVVGTSDGIKWVGPASYLHPLNPQGFQGMRGWEREVSEPLVQVWDWVSFSLKMGEGLEDQVVAQMLPSLPSLHQ